MAQALQKAKEYDTGKSPYGIPVYPYVWEKSSWPFILFLNMDEPFRAVFSFERQRVGVLIHVSVWQKTGAMTADVVTDISLHLDAVHHLRGLMHHGKQNYRIDIP
jgi:hypothetical protein